MKYPVKPVTHEKRAIAELQRLTRRVVTGLAANTAFEVPDLEATDTLHSVLGYNGSEVLASNVVDFTEGCAITAVTRTITGITLTAGQPVAITANSHLLEDGDYVMFSNTVGGAVELRNKGFIVTETGVNTFTLNGTNGANFTAWTSGGFVTLKKGKIACTENTASHRLVVEFYKSPV